MSKVLLLTTDFPPRRGGVARYLDGLARFYNANMRVIAQPERGSTSVDVEVPYSVERESLLTRWLWPRWLRAVWVLWRERQTYDCVILSHVLPLGTAAWVAKRITGKSYIVIVHGMDIGLVKRFRWKRWLAERILQHARVVVANTNSLAEEVRGDFDVSETVTIYPTPTIPEAVKGSRPSSQRIELITVARLVKRKGVERVLRALKLLDEKKGFNFHYRIIGAGPENASLKEKINTYGLSDRVELLEGVDDNTLWEYYHQADVFVMPTVWDSVDREGFGLVYLEAALAGVPSIATDHPGVNEAVLDQETGLLVPDGDIGALADAIWRLNEDVPLRKRLGQQAKHRVRKNFQPEQQYAKLHPYLSL